jgi:hypothetical protein
MANLYAEGTEVDHVELIARLEEYDGWALSTHVPGLAVVLPILPERAHVCAWVKPWVAMKPGARLQYAWEPVVIAPVRAPRRSVHDWIAANPTRMRGMVGAKPEALAWWMFAAAGLLPGDELVDLYPGTGAVMRAWEKWHAQIPLELGPSEGASRRLVASLGLEG